MRIPEEHWQHAPVALPPIHLPRGLVNRLNIDNSGDPINAEWASATIAYVLARGLDAIETASAELVATTTDPIAALKLPPDVEQAARNLFAAVGGKRPL